jgi:hypothetical protein
VRRYDPAMSRRDFLKAVVALGLSVGATSCSQTSKATSSSATTSSVHPIETTQPASTAATNLTPGTTLSTTIAPDTILPPSQHPDVSPTPSTQPALPSSLTATSSGLAPNQKIAIATDYLKGISEELYQIYTKFGLDENVADYVIFTQSLPKDFRLYTLGNRLCIKDRKFTDLEKQFLTEPEKYLQPMFDTYVSGIAAIDSEMATQVKKLPYFKTVEVEDIEAIEDFLWLASIPKYRPTLEKIYGRGIQRQMHSVALEALMWRAYAYTGSYFTYNPLDDSRYAPILTRLAEFQEKYNTEMDADAMPDIKFDIKGMNYHAEPTGGLLKSVEDYEFDIALIRWVLRCNTVRLWGNLSTARAISFMNLAKGRGLDVYFTAVPNASDGSGSKAAYESALVEYAKSAQTLGVKYLSVGNEIELWWQEFGGGPWASTPASNENRKAGKIASYVDELVKLVRQHYSGCITYNDYHAADGTGLMNWQNLDAISLNIYGNYLWSRTYLQSMQQVANTLNKPLYWTELGSLTITEAEVADGDDSYTWENTVHHDEGKQAEVIEHFLNIASTNNVVGIFVFVWDRSTWNNQNELGFGIWDCVKKEPKKSFWTVYKYFKEK